MDKLLHSIPRGAIIGFGLCLIVTLIGNILAGPSETGLGVVVRGVGLTGSLLCLLLFLVFKVGTRFLLKEVRSRAGSDAQRLGRQARPRERTHWRLPGVVILARVVSIMLLLFAIVSLILALIDILPTLSRGVGPPRLWLVPTLLIPTVTSGATAFMIWLLEIF